MSAIEVHTQAELDKALANLRDGDYVVCLGGTRYDPLRVTGSAHVVARESAHVVARGSAHVEAWDSAHVAASQFVSVHRHPAHRGRIDGGVVIAMPDETQMTAAEWCGYYGVTVTRGNALLYKALDDDLSTERARQCGITYTVGSRVKAPDWDPVPDCGNGLHACPSPAIAARYNQEATRFVRVRAKLAGLVVLGDKVKAPALTVVCECDRYGEPLAGAEAS